MDKNLILEGKATVEDLMMLSGLGYEFDVHDGNIVDFRKAGKDE